MTGTFRLDLRPSIGWAGVLSLLHLVALAAAIVSLTGIPRILVCLGVVLSVTGVMKRLFGMRDIGVAALELLEDGSTAWCDRAGQWHPVKTLTASYVSPWLTIVRLEPDEPGVGSARWLLLGPDSGRPEHLRQLRVWLSEPKSLAGRKSPDAD